MKEATLMRLKESEEKYRHLFDTAPVAIFLTDMKGTIFDINKAGENLFTKYKRTEIIGKSVLFLLNIVDDPKKYLPRLKQRIKLLLHGEKPPPVEYYVKRDDGSSIWVKVSNSLVQINNKPYIQNIIQNITHQKLSEKKLKESEEKYRLISENATDIISVHDGNFRVIYVNENALMKLLGYKKEDLIGKSAIWFAHPNDQERILQDFMKVFEQKEMITEGRLKHKDGKYIWTEFSGKLFIDENNKPKFLLITRDITEKKRIEQSLKESEKKYRMISEYANDLISVFNHKFKYEYINEKPHLEVLGYSKEDLIGKSPVKMIHPDDFNAFVKSFQGRTDLSSGTHAYRIKHKNGTWRWLEFRGRIIQDEITGKEKYISISRDVTTQKIALDELQKKEELLRKFIEESYDGVVLTDEKGIITHWNRGQENIFGLKKKEVIERPIWDVMFQIIPDNKKTEDNYYQTKSTIQQSLKTGKSYWLNKLAEVEFQDLYGTHKFVQQLPFPIKVTKGYIFGSICRDITEMKISEERIKASEEQYRKAYNQANFYKDLFAHDFSNILSIISGSSQLCSIYLNEITNGIHLRDNLELIKDQVMRAKNLINNVRKLSIIQESTLLIKSIELKKLLNESVEYISRSFQEKNIKIKIESPHKEIIVQANELLSDVFDNILINAIIYTENPTVKIIIRESNVVKEGREFLKLEFIDNGIGIPDNRKKKIFDKRQEKEDFVKGMGIGLTLVKTIIESFRGSIWVENAIQGDFTKGSNFILLIPGKN